MKISGYHFVALQLLSLGTTEAVSSLRIKGDNNKRQNIAFKSSSTIDSSFDSVSLPSSNQRRRQQELAPGLPKKRDCKLKSKKYNGVEFDCTAESDDQELKIKDQIRFKIGTSSSGASVKVEYANKVMETTEAKNRTASSDRNTNTETKTKYEIVYNSIIEYKKGGTRSNSTKNSRSSNKTTIGQEYEFDSNDEILQTIPLTEWEDMSEILHDNDNVTSYFWARTVDQMVIFNFTVSRAAAANGKTEHSVTANKMKIDFWLQNFPWMRDDTYVALLSTVQSERHIKVEEIGIDNTVGESAGVVKASSVDSNTNSTAAKSGITEQTMQKVQPKSIMTEKVTVSFNDAMEATGNVLSMGEYTWDSTAKVVSSKQNKPNVPVATLAPSDVSSEDDQPDGMRQLQPSDNTEEDLEKDENAEVVDEKNVDEIKSEQKQDEKDEIEAEEKDAEANTVAGEDAEEGTGDKKEEEVVGNEAEKDLDENDEAKTEDKESGSEMVTTDIEGAVIQVIATTSIVPVTAEEGGHHAGKEEEAFTKQTIAFSFIGKEAHQAELIYWDPEAGINYQTVSSSAVSSFVSSWSTIMSITTLATAASAMLVCL